MGRRPDADGARAERRQVRKRVMDLRDALHGLEKVDLSDPVAVEERWALHYSECARLDLIPTLGSVAIAFGCSVDDIRRVGSGYSKGWGGTRFSPASAEVFIKNLMEMEGIFNANFENGSYANPVTGIFAAKNNYGWVDAREEHVVTMDVTPDPKAIEARYSSALPMHDNGHGKVYRLHDGISTHNASKRAEQLRGRLENGEYGEPPYEVPGDDVESGGSAAD